MSQFYVPGQTYHFLGIPDDSGQNPTYEFVGFVERETPISLMGTYKDVNTDYAGEALPADVLYLGDVAMMSLTFTRYNETSINKLKARIKSGTPGIGATGSIGTLMVTEGQAFSWVALSGYRGKPVFNAGSMNQAYFFNAVYPVDSMDFALSTSIKLERVTLRTIPVFNASGAWQSYQIGLPSGVTLPEVN